MVVMGFPAKKNAGCQKAQHDFPQENMAFSTPHRVALRLPSPSPESVCTDRWMGRRMLLTHDAPLCGLWPQRSFAMTVPKIIFCIDNAFLRQSFQIYPAASDFASLLYTSPKLCQ